MDRVKVHFNDNEEASRGKDDSAKQAVQVHRHIAAAMAASGANRQAKRPIGQLGWSERPGSRHTLWNRS